MKKINLNLVAKRLMGDNAQLPFELVNENGQIRSSSRDLLLADVVIANLDNTVPKSYDEAKSIKSLAEKVKAKTPFDVSDEEFESIYTMFKNQLSYMQVAFYDMVEELNPKFKFTAEATE